MNSYFGYGLNIRSQLLLPELPGGGDRADVVIGLGEIEVPDQEHPYPLVRNVSGDIFITIYRVGRFLIQKGHRVIIDPLPEVDERALRIYLLGMVMGILLFQRGKHVFHASAVELSGQAFAFMGAKGAGKSCTAGIFHAAGCQLLSDDILALSHKNGSVLVFPGFAQLKLMPDAARYLQLIPETHETIHPLMDKHPHSILQGFASEPMNLKRVYLLQQGETNEIVPLNGKQAMKEVLSHWYGAQFGMSMIQALGARDYLRQCAALAECIPVRLLRRRQDLSVFPELLGLVKRDLIQEI